MSIFLDTLRLLFILSALLCGVLWMRESIRQFDASEDGWHYEPHIFRPIIWALLALLFATSTYALSCVSDRSGTPQRGTSEEYSVERDGVITGTPKSILP